jgi:CheY-like chemotaxis protein
MKKKILIVDDDHDIHPLLVKMIEKVNKGDSKKFGEIDSMLADIKGQEKDSPEKEKGSAIDFNFDHAFQGEEALKYVDQATTMPYDVVFMDVRMPPGIDGIQTIKEIRKLRPNYPFIICTAYMDYTWEEVVKILGSEKNIALMKKPFTKQKIAENLKSLLKEA